MNFPGKPCKEKLPEPQREQLIPFPCLIHEHVLPKTQSDVYHSSLGVLLWGYMKVLAPCPPMKSRPFPGFPHYASSFHTLLIITCRWAALLQVSFCLAASKAGGWASGSKPSLDPGGLEHPSCTVPPATHPQPASHRHRPPCHHQGMTCSDLHMFLLWWGNGVKGAGFLDDFLRKSHALHTDSEWQLQLMWIWC